MGCMRSPHLPGNQRKAEGSFRLRYDLTVWLRFHRCPRFPFAVALPPPFPVSLLVESGEKKRNEIKRTRLAKECVLDHGGLLENRRKSEFVFQRSDTRVRLKTRRVKGDVNRGEKSEGKRHGEEGDFRRRKRR